VKSVTVSISVYGKVQGVFFRKYTIDAAKKNGITGFVKNANDGTVYIEATGTKDMLNEFIEWCNTGSPNSQVDRVEVYKMPLTQYTGFSIRY
jgi:acylphosphatase